MANQFLGLYPSNYPIRLSYIPDGNNITIYKVTALRLTGTWPSPAAISTAEPVYTGTLYNPNESGTPRTIDIQPIVKDFVNHKSQAAETVFHNYYRNDVTKTLQGSMSVYGQAYYVSEWAYPIYNEFPFEEYYFIEDSEGVHIVSTYENGSGKDKQLFPSEYNAPKVLNDYPVTEFYNGTFFSITYLYPDHTRAYGSSSWNYENPYIDVWFEHSGCIRTTLFDRNSSEEMYNLIAKDSWTWGGCLDLYSDLCINTIDFPTDDKIVAFQILDSNEDPLTPEFKVMNCIPDDTVFVYYVNLKGGFDFIPCTLKNKRTVNATRNQILTNADYHDRTEFGTKTYMTEAKTQYTLNTEIMDDEQSKKMRDLFLSDKVWILDKENVLHSVNITDQSLTIKKRSNDKIFNYTINCQDSISEYIY